MPDPITGTVAAVGGSQVLSSRSAAKASKRAAETQAASGREAIQFQREQADKALDILGQLDPVIGQGLDQVGFLADPRAQFDFLQSSPLFQLALDQANAGTLQGAAATGRLSAGDTKSELARNVILSSLPLIDAQRQDVSNLINLGTSALTSKANVLQGLSAGVSPVITDIGASRAAGIIGASNARQQGLQNLFGLFGQFAGGGAFGPGLQNVFGA